MNILIINGSPRKGGNTELLADVFAKGATANHHAESRLYGARFL